MPFIERKTIPLTHRNHREVHNGPDVPSVQFRGINRLGIFIPNGHGHIIPTELEEIGSITIKKGHASARGIVIVPLRREPLVPLFQTSHGGRRFGGGGISKEALRRAKRQMKRR